MFVPYRAFLLQAGDDVLEDRDCDDGFLRPASDL